MSSLSGADIIKLAPLFELVLRQGIAAVERQRQKPIGAMTREEIAEDLAALEDSIRPWDSPAGDDEGEGNTGALG